MEKAVIDNERKNLIVRCVNFFEKYKIDYALACGAACCWLKDNEIYIPAKEHDIDFFIRKEDYQKVLANYNEFEKSGISINKKSPKVQMFSPCKENHNKKYIMEFYFIEKIQEAGKMKFKTNDENEKIVEWDWDNRITKSLDNKIIKVVSDTFCNTNDPYKTKQCEYKSI